MTLIISQVLIDDSSDRVISGVQVYDRDNGGVLVVPSGTAFPAPTEAGELFWRSDLNFLYRRNDANSGWSSVSVNPATIEHGDLLGLGDDDHPQYQTDARADTWLGTKTTANLAEGVNLYYTEGRVSANASVAANTAHRNITGNPHSTTAGDVGADPAGTAASAVSAHEALPDPHPGYVLESREGQLNGIATLDGTGNVPLSQLGNVVGGLSYLGTWNASTNTPTIISGVGTLGEFYRVGTSGTTNIDGITDWVVGDWIIFDGTAWQKLDNTDQVASVFGRAGVVTAQAGDYTATQVNYSPATSGLVATDVQAAIDEVEGRVDAFEASQNVYGQNRVYASDETTTTTTGVNYVTKVSLSTGAIPAGIYRLEWSCEARVSAISRQIGLRAVFNGLQVSNVQWEAKDASDFYPLSGFYEGALGAGTFDMLLTFARVGFFATVSIRAARLSFIRVA